MVMPATSEQKYTAVQTILLAAEDLTKAGYLEFSEFDLTVAAWNRDRAKFGLRGYSDKYPDHKRVMMEIMGQKPNSPVYRKLLEKLRPNTYRLTPAGKDQARRLRTGADNPPKPAAPVVAVPVAPAAPVRATVAARTGAAPSRDLYEVVAQYTGRPEFRRWQDHPEEPRDWATASVFLGLQKGFDVDPVERVEEIRESIKLAMDWCNQTETSHLSRTGGQPGSPIHFNDLAGMLDFLQVLTQRFPNHLDRKPAKPKKRFED